MNQEIKQDIQKLITASLAEAGKKVLNYAYYCATVFLICYACVSWIFGEYDKDSTDSHNKRSGVHLRTDYGTGCQYLESRNGGLTPRLDVNGAHVGCKPKSNNTH